MSRLQHETNRRLILAGYTPDHPAIAAIRAWNTARRESANPKGTE
jgi:hypothetical protein